MVDGSPVCIWQDAGVKRVRRQGCPALRSKPDLLPKQGSGLAKGKFGPDCRYTRAISGGHAELAQQTHVEDALLAFALW